MGKKMQYGLVVWLRDEASRGLKRIQRHLGGIGKSTRRAFGIAGVGLGMFAGLARAAVRVAGTVIGIFTRLVSKVVGLFVGLVSKVAGVLKGLVKTTAVVAAGVAVSFMVMLRSVAKLGDEIAKMSKRTGLSVKFLAEMRHVLALNDMVLDDLLKAMRGLGRAVEGGVRGAGEYLEVWDALGVSFRESNGRIKDSAKLFEEVIDALRRVENRTLRMGMAQRIFGRAGTQMLTLVESTTASLQRQRAEAAALGATWIAKYAGASERVLDAWSRVALAWQGAKAAFLGPFLGAATDTLDWFAQLLAGSQSRLDVWGRTIADVFGKAAKAVRDFFDERTWQWKNIEAGLQQAGQVLEEYKSRFLALFAFRDEGAKVQAGPLVAGIVAAFEWAAAQIEGIFKALWIRIGHDLTSRVGTWIADIAASFSASLMRAQEKGAQERWEFFRTRGGILGEPWRKPWAEMGREDKERAVREWGRVHPILARQHRAEMALARMVTETGIGMGQPLVPAEKEAATARVKAEADEKAAAAATRLSEALERASGLMEGLGGGLGAAAQRAAPRKPEAQLAREQAAQMPEVAATERYIAMLGRRAEHLERHGYLEQAQAALVEQARVNDALILLLNRIAELQAGQAQEAQELRSQINVLRTRVGRIARARA